MSEVGGEKRKPRYDLGEPGPDSFTAHLNELRNAHTAKRVREIEDERGIPNIQQIHEEFELAINDHLKKKGNNLGNFLLKKKKSVKH